MPVVNFILHDGSKLSVEGDVGTPIMILAKKQGIEGIFAECGGACCCATCHVHLDPEWTSQVPSMEDDERDMLEFADNVDDHSRLSCQLKLTDAIDSIVVNVPESQY